MINKNLPGYAPGGLNPPAKYRLNLNNRQKILVKYFTAGLGFVSELIHLWLLPEQYEVFIGYGSIFLLIAIAQGFTAALVLFAPGRRTLTFGIRFNVLVVFGYIFTHTFGVIVGTALMQLPVDGWGIIATVAEVGIIALLYLLRRDHKKHKKVKSKKKSAIHD